MVDKVIWIVTELLNVVVCTTSDFFCFFPVNHYKLQRRKILDKIGFLSYYNCTESCLFVINLRIKQLIMYNNYYMVGYET